MPRRPITYLMLAGFAAVMVARLMLDDPTTRQAQFAEVQAALQSQQLIGLFPELERLEQITMIEVLDITSGQDIRLVRNEQGQWYAPDLSSAIDQTVAQNAALSIAMMASQQRYEATPENLEIFGFEPQPAYRVAFAAHDTAGVAYAPVILEVGDVNPDNMAYYVWPVNDKRIYLIPKNEIMDPLLAVTAGSVQLTSEATAPVP